MAEFKERLLFVKREYFENNHYDLAMSLLVDEFTDDLEDLKLLVNEFFDVVNDEDIVSAWDDYHE